MTRIFKTFFKYLVAIILIASLGAIGLDATDHRGNLQESIIGKLIFGASDSRCPADMVFLTSDHGGFCMDKFEISLSEECPFPQPSSRLESQANIEKPDCRPLSVEGATPWTNISQDQAIRACAKLGKRLPTNNEWQQAALGTNDKDDQWTGEDCHVASNWNNQPGLTGSGKNCVSYAGAYDMIGNVWEWVNNSIDDGKYDGRELPKEGYVNGIDTKDSFPSDTSATPDPIYYNDYYWIKNTENRGVVRGGYWDNKADAGQYAVYAVTKKEDVGKAIGFRCAK